MHKWTGSTRCMRCFQPLTYWLALVLLIGFFTCAASAQGLIANLQPNSLPAGFPAFDMTLTVTNLPAGSYTVFWNSTPLVTSVVNSGQLSAAVTADLVQFPGTAQVRVQTQLAVGAGAVSTPSVTFTITGPIISFLQPSSVQAGSAAFTLTVNGSGFQIATFASTPLISNLSGFQFPSFGPLVFFGDAELSTTFVNANQLTATVPATLIQTPGSVSVTVMNPDETFSAPANFTIRPAFPPLVLTTQFMPSAPANSSYAFTFQATGGSPPLTFSATGLPSTLTMNPSTGAVTGSTGPAGSFTANVTVRDSLGQTVTGRFPFQVLAPIIIPLQFVTSSLPAGQVGVAYFASIMATGGTGPYVYTLDPASGSPPAGLRLNSDGSLSGTPTTAGTTRFSVQVQDTVFATVSQAFSVTIAPPPLSVTGGPTGNAPVGTALKVSFGATGGTSPYTFSSSAGIPPGTTFNSDGTLTGAPTTQGTYQFTVTVKDSTGAVASKSFSIIVVAPLLAISTASLPNGQVGLPYSVQLFAINGQTPYQWTASGAPAGVTMSPTGSLSGTPTADGPFSIAVTVTDAAGNSAKQTYSITIATAPLVITTGSLGTVVAGTAFSATLAATGGSTPYTFAAQGLPAGITASPAGAVSGTPTTAGSYTVTVTVTDAKGATATKTLILTVTASPINITTASLPNGTVQTAYSATVAATGGAGSNKWTATGLPSGLTMSTAGTISGTPTAPGTSIVVVTVTDSAGTVAVQTYTLNILVPVPSGVAFNNLPATANAGSQLTAQLGINGSYPVPVTATLTLTFAPDSGADDPAVQFSSGGRTVVIQVPVGLIGSAPLQIGTVAGTITITAQLSASGQDITPSPAPKQTVRIAPAAPSITSVTAVRTASGFTVTVIGFATPRQVTQATFTFTAQASANLQTSTLTVPVTSLFDAWYSSSASAPFGSQFSFVQPFNVSGSLQGITSVTVTLTNAQGNSATGTANLQ